MIFFKMRLAPSEAAKRIDEQNEKFSGAVISGVALDTVREVFRIAQILKLKPPYLTYAETRFLWEIMDMGEDTEVLKMVKNLAST